MYSVFPPKFVILLLFFPLVVHICHSVYLFVHIVFNSPLNEIVFYVTFELNILCLDISILAHRLAGAFVFALFFSV